MRPLHDDAHDQPLIQGLRAAIRDPLPLQLPLAVSAIVQTLRPDPADPDHEPPVDLATLVQSFVDTDVAETTAALHALAALLDDELLLARIDRCLRGRRQPVPVDVARLRDVRVHEAVLMTEPMGDGDDVLLHLVGPGLPHGAMFLVYVDHDLGTVVKDAFVVAEPFASVLERMHELADEQGVGQRFEALRPADARAVVEDALRSLDDLALPVRSETWPMCRPLLEMVLRTMPAGGSPPVRGAGRGLDHLEDLEVADPDLVHDFLASREASDLADLDAELVHDAAHTVADFVANSPGSDPLRVSAVVVEVALTRAFPVAPVPEDEIAVVPQVLAAYARWAHRLLASPRALVADVEAAVDRWEPVFRQLCDDPEVVRMRHAAAEQAALLDDLADPLAWGRRMLADEVGGQEALLALDDTPLPDEALDLAAVPQHVRDRVVEVAALVDAFCDAHADHELRTACRRFLVRVAAADPAILGRGRVDTAAAAVCWAVGRANGVVSGVGAPVLTRDLTAWFGVTGSPSTRGRTMLRAVGGDEEWFHLGSPDLLAGSYRRALLARRELLQRPDRDDESP